MTLPGTSEQVGSEEMGNSVPSDDVGLYGDYRNWKGWVAEGFGRYSVAEGLYYQAELTSSRVGPLRGLDMLEVGFGNGSFAGWARDNGVRYRGIEVNPESLAVARSCDFDVYESFEQLRDGVQDRTIRAVVAFDIFEHLDAAGLLEMLAEIRGVLVPGGLLVARVPSGDSPFSRHAQHGDMTHRLTIGSSIVDQLAAAVDFEVLAVREPATCFKGLGVVTLLRRGMVSACRAVLYPLIRYAFMSGAAVVLTPTIVFVLRKPDPREDR